MELKAPSDACVFGRDLLQVVRVSQKKATKKVQATKGYQPVFLLDESLHNHLMDIIETEVLHQDDEGLIEEAPVEEEEEEGQARKKPRAELDAEDPLYLSPKSPLQRASRSRGRGSGVKPTDLFSQGGRGRGRGRRGRGKGKGKRGVKNLIDYSYAL